MSVDSSIPYATPSRRPSAAVLAGASILSGGLGLVFLGGCFLIGVLIINAAAAENVAAGGQGLTPSLIVLMCVLYAAAFACFGGALALMVIATRALLRVFKS